jgi:hypothetical protein
MIVLVRFTSESGQEADHLGKSALCHKRTYAVQQIVRLFDYLVGELLELQWHFEPERLSGFHVDAQHELGRELDGQFRRFGAFQNLVDEVGRPAVVLKIVDSVTDEPSGLDK